MKLRMSAPQRKVPRIMAKSFRSSKTSQCARGGEGNTEQGSSDATTLTQELDDEHEQLLVRNGVVVGLQQPNGQFVDESGMQVPNSVVLTYPRARRIVIESASDDNNDYEPYVPSTLPGVADEVESYPCPLCPERVFLTSFGLERHSLENHPHQLQEIREHITTISTEWRRREEELARRRERIYSARVRHENITRLAVEQVVNGILDSQMPADLDGNVDSSGPLRERHYKVCALCGLLITADSSEAMQSHMNAHKKNHYLKQRLFERYGPEEVGRLMCRECNMVFIDEKSLLMHGEHTHVRRRKYVCKWCGHVVHSMTELNAHKADVHAMPPSVVKSERERKLKEQHFNSIGVVALGSHPKRSELEDRYGPSNTSTSDLCFRTTCDQCGLRLVRPSLLVRHMLRAHSLNTFSCEIEAPGACNYQIKVDHGRITWICCGSQYTARREFLLHRVGSHLEKVMEGETVNDCQPSGSTQSNLGDDMEPGDDACIQNSHAGPIYLEQMDSFPADVMQVEVPEEMLADGKEIYVLIENNDHLNNRVVYEHLNSGEQQIEPQPDQILSPSHLQGMLVDGHNENDGEVVTVTAEQYQQLRLQYGDSLRGVDVVFVKNDELLSETNDRSAEVLGS